MRQLSISASARMLLTAFTLTASGVAFAQQPGNSVVSTSTPDTPTAATWHETDVPADRKINTKVTDGVLTVDGLVAKVQLNYEIHDASFLYVYVPGLGTAVVSRVNTYGSEKVKDAFHGKTLAFKVGGHSFELTSTTPMTEGKEPKQELKEAKQEEAKQEKLARKSKQGKGPEVTEVKDGKNDIYVRLDTATVSLDRYPMFGFGSTTRSPYAWPLSGPPTKDTTAHLVTPPPMPASVLPRTMAPVGATPHTSDRQ